MFSRRRSGYTLIEMMTVLVIVGTIAMLSTPQLQVMRANAAFRSAQTEMGAYLSQARAVAVQRGREAHFVMNGNSISVTVDSAGTQVTFARPVNVQREYGVSLTGTRSDFVFDPRGFAVGNTTMERIRLTRGALLDSICITKLGKVIYRGCSL